MIKTSSLSSTTISISVTLLLSLAIGLLTLTPIHDPGFLGSDKLHHFLAFVLLTFPVSVIRPRLALWITLGAIAYGGAIELIQPLVGRDRELLDFLMDVAGCVSGFVSGFYVWWTWRRLQ